MAQTTRQDLVQAYFSGQASAYDENPRRPLWSWLRRREAHAVMSMLGDVQGVNALDLGCGAGFYSRLLLTHDAANVTAVDNCPDMISALPEDARLTPINCDAGELPAVGPFDRIVSAGLLEFVEVPETVVAAARRTIAADGVLVLLLPMRNLAGHVYARWHAGHSVVAKLFNDDDIAKLAGATAWRVDGATFVWPFSLVVRLTPAS